MTDISLDTETGLIIPGVLAPPLVCATFAQDGEADIEHVHGEMHALLEELLDRRDGALWLLNGAYDMGVIATEYPDLMPSIFDAYDAGRILDVGINAMLLDLAAGCFEGYRVVDGETVKYGYSLKELAERFGGMVLSKGEDTWRLRYIELRDVPLERWPAEAKSYALDDARATLAPRAPARSTAIPTEAQDTPARLGSVLVALLDEHFENVLLRAHCTLGGGSWVKAAR